MAKSKTKHKPIYNRSLKRIKPRTWRFILGGLLLLFIVVGIVRVRAADPTPVGQSGSWNLVFQDNFDGSTLDANKWTPNWHAGGMTTISPPINDYEDGCYDPKQVSLSNGTLKFKAERVTTSRPGCVDKSRRTAQYASGLIHSDDKFNFTYGYAETRMYLPPGSGSTHNWPAFWTNGQNWPEDGEIDIMEGIGGDTNWHYHFANSSGNHDSHDGDVRTNNKAGWHTYAAHWEPGKITFFYDGVNVGQVTSNVINKPHYLIANYAVSSELSPPITVPSVAEVDYIRVWKKGTGTTTPPTDTQIPTVSLTSPRNGATLTGTSSALSATASDNVGVSKVVFQVDGREVNTDTSSPYGYNLNTTTLSNGSHTVSAIAYDAANNRSQTSTVNVTVSNVVAPANRPPVVSVSTVGNTFTEPATVLINAASSDPDGSVTRVEFYSGQTKLGEDTSSPYSLSSRFSAGTYSITARATDDKGASTTSSAVSITINRATTTPPPPPAGTKPSAPTSPSRTLMFEWFRYYLDIGWKAPASSPVPVKDYVITIVSPEATRKATSTTPNYKYYDAKAGLNYKITVQSRSNEGVLSDPSQEINAKGYCIFIFCALE